ncbi:MAG: ABC transporter permease [Anaerolineae bacterium]|nr:ABC transporter permease [Anaerolineae bacterium]
MSWDNLLQAGFIISLITSGIRLAVPVLLAVLGEIITERAGVQNLGLEGIMAFGAFAGFAAAFATDSGILGLLAGILAGMLMGLLMGYFAVTLKVNQVIAGISLVLLGQGAANFFYRQIFGVSQRPPRIAGFPEMPIPLLSDIPYLGDILFRHNVVVYLTVLLVILIWIALFETTWGLKVRAVGEHPSAADTSGVNVAGIRYACTILGAAFAGLGGAVLSVAQMKLFTENMVAGRGWIAIALVIFSRWHPGLALAGAVLFGLADALQFRFQALGFEAVPYEFLLMLPYILTIIVLLAGGRRGAAPAALGTPYEKE